MLAKPELYKGISYVRIAALPGDQKVKIRENYSRELIVKILRDDALINDCIIYNDYVKWYNTFIKTLEHNEIKSQQEVPSALELVKK